MKKWLSFIINYIKLYLMKSNKKQSALDELLTTDAKPAPASESIELAAPVVASDSALTETALGMFKNKSGQWMVSVVKYNPETGDAALEKLVPGGADKIEALHRFRITAADLLSF